MSVHPILPLFFVGWGDFLFIYGCMGGDDGCTGRMAVCLGVSSVPLWSGAYSMGEFCG